MEKRRDYMIKRISLMVLLMVVIWCPMGQAKVTCEQDEFNGFTNSWSNTTLILPTQQKETKVSLNLTLGEMGKQGEEEFGSFYHLPHLSYQVIEDTETTYKDVQITRIEMKIDNDKANVIDMPINRKYNSVDWWVQQSENKRRLKEAQEITLRITTVHETYIITISDSTLQEWKQVLTAVSKSPSQYQSWDEYDKTHRVK